LIPSFDVLSKNEDRARNDYSFYFHKVKIFSGVRKIKERRK
jgi:hypothetical protein